MSEEIIEAPKQETLPPEKLPVVVPKRELAAGAEIAPIVPQNVAELAMIADAFIRAGMVPSSYDSKLTGEDGQRETKSRVMIGVMKGLEVGMGPVTALSTIMIVNNRPCVWGDGAVALAQRTGLVEKLEQVFEGTGEAVADEKTIGATDFPDDMTAVCRIWRKGQTEPYVGRFSVRDAKRAHLWGNVKKAPWIEYPKRMLAARARAFALRDGFADALMGLAIREEIEDLPAPPAAKADTSFLEDAAAPAEATEAA